MKKVIRDIYKNMFRLMLMDKGVDGKVKLPDSPEQQHQQKQKQTQMQEVQLLLDEFDTVLVSGNSQR